MQRNSPLGHAAHGLGRRTCRGRLSRSTRRYNWRDLFHFKRGAGGRGVGGEGERRGTCRGVRVKFEFILCPIGRATRGAWEPVSLVSRNVVIGRRLPTSRAGVTRCGVRSSSLSLRAYPDFPSHLHQTWLAFARHVQVYPLAAGGGPREPDIHSGGCPEDRRRHW